MKQIGLEFQVLPADIDASIWTGESGPGYVQRMAAEKNVVVRQKCSPEGVVIAADTADEAWRADAKPRSR